MNASEHLFQYCERGHSVFFWAEPLNALSNGMFALAGIAAIFCLSRNRATVGGSQFAVISFLILLLFVISVGSFLFHTFANHWTELADQIPITVFVFSYLTFALRTFLWLRWWATVAIMFGFVAISFFASSATCLLPAPNAAQNIGDTACLWGSVAYAPALAALWTIGWALRQHSHAVAPFMLAAGAVFTLSLTMRTLDIPTCAWTVVLGKTVGTHFIWHILNACTLFILVRAAIVAAAGKEPRDASER